MPEDGTGRLVVRAGVYDTPHNEHFVLGPGIPKPCTGLTKPQTPHVQLELVSEESSSPTSGLEVVALLAGACWELDAMAGPSESVIFGDDRMNPA